MLIQSTLISLALAFTNVASSESHVNIPTYDDVEMMAQNIGLDCLPPTNGCYITYSGQRLIDVSNIHFANNRDSAAQYLRDNWKRIQREAQEPVEIIPLHNDTQYMLLFRG